MKRTAIVISSILTSILTLPTVAGAKNNYPVFPERPTDAPNFSDLSDDVANAYLEDVKTYQETLATEYQNGEYDWDFNLDGNVDVFDAYYPIVRWSELSMGEELDSFPLKIWDKKKNTISLHTLPFASDMRAKVDLDGDISGDGRIDVFDAQQMLIAIYSDKESGNVNTDGKLDARDASKMLSFYSANSVNIESDYVTEKNMEYLGDLNDDGKTDAKDASDVLAIYASNSTQPPDESKVVWTETEPGEQVEYSSVYKIFDRDKNIGQTKLVFNGTVTDIKEYAVSGQYENGEKWGPSNRTIIEVAVNDVYYGDTNKKTIKLFYNTSLSMRPKGSFMIETGREYFFIAKELDDNEVQNLDAAKYTDLAITAGLRDGIMPVSDGIVSVYHEYFDDNETAKAEALAKDEVMDKLTDDAKAANWFMYFNKADFVEFLSELFNS